MCKVTVCTTHKSQCAILEATGSEYTTQQFLQSVFHVTFVQANKLTCIISVHNQLVPRSKYHPSVVKTDRLMLCGEVIADCSETHTKHVNTLCGLKVEFLSVKLYGMYSNH